MQRTAVSFALVVLQIVSQARLTSGFAVVPPWQQAAMQVARQNVVLRLSDEPSDTYRDDFKSFAKAARDTFQTTSDVLVNNVLDIMPRSLSLVGEISTETRAAINELLLKLEASNPTKDPTLSPLLNGVWELRYAGLYTSDWALPSPTRQLALFLYSGGYSPGLFALGVAQQLPFCQVGELEVSISRQQPRIEAKIPVQFGFGSSGTINNINSRRNDNQQDVTIKARLEVLSEVRMRETYEDISIPRLSSTWVELPQAFQYSRELFVCYLDEDLLVVRDASGVPEVLVRKGKVFSQTWGTEPSEVEDMLPPGQDDLPGAD